MKIKVCGMKYPANIEAVAALGPDYIGFIFCAASPRDVSKDDPPETVGDQIPTRVGVFVNEDHTVLRETAERWKLEVLQLHGDESVEDVQKIRAENSSRKIWKAFRIESEFSFESLEEYSSIVDAFLFDTPGDGYGGTGRTFQWGELGGYQLDTDVVLSGGIGPEQIRLVPALVSEFPGLRERIIAIDVNSKLEDRPAMKNVARVKEAVDLVRQL